MTPGAWIAIFGTLLTVILAVIAAVFWAGKVTAKLDILVQDSSNAKAKLETFQASCFTKVEAAGRLTESDNQHKAIWKKIDALRKAVIELFQKEGLDFSKQDL